MPVGIPKVAYLIPGDDDASWVELYNRIYYDRLLFLGEEINSEIANRLTGLMVFLSIQDKKRDLYLFINSPGGELVSGMALFDAMHFVKAEVNTICMGVAASMASLILVGGERTKRLAFRHAHVMMHQPASSLLDGKSGRCLLNAKQVMDLRNQIILIYAQRTGKSPWQIADDMERDVFMTAEEAQDYGIIDTIAGSEGDVLFNYN
uniref:ATP-dependent Clp protease proteolytic subunit n=1 Tax=Astragalus calycosus var. calycosus TaxID=2873497 RepID=A0A8K1JFG2_9FABA|nr:clp protease proteolytic subunit [Astragalus calycosus var. calycosus]